MGSIKWKMATLYMLLVVTVMIGSGVLILFTLRNDAYREVYQQSEYTAERLVDVLSVQDIPAPEKVKDVFSEVALSLAIENANTSASSGSVMSVYLLDAEGKLLYTRKEPLSESDLSSRAIMMALMGEEMEDLYIHDTSQGEEVADYALRFTLPQTGEDFILFIRQDLTTVQRSLSSMTLIILFITSIGIVVAGFMGYLLAVSISKPIERLTQKTQELAEGAITQEEKEPAMQEEAVKVRPSGDELDLLEVHFDDMAREMTRSIRELQQMEQMQKEFVANVSHELRTPITTVKSYVETLLDSDLTDTDLTKRFLTVVSHEADRMTALVTDLLELSKMDSNQVETVWDPVEMGALLRQTMADMEWDAIQKEQRILWARDMVLLKEDEEDDSSLRLPEDTYWIQGDSRRLEQVLRNLLTNAIKYSPKGAVIQGSVSKKKGKILVCIKDNGIGISKEDQEHIFDRFYRVDKARSRSMGGTGLGLAIAKQTTELFHGRIYVESEPKVGSSFFLEFPEYVEGGVVSK